MKEWSNNFHKCFVYKSLKYLSSTKVSKHLNPIYQAGMFSNSYMKKLQASHWKEVMVSNLVQNVFTLSWTFLHTNEPVGSRSSLGTLTGQTSQYRVLISSFFFVIDNFSLLAKIITDTYFKYLLHTHRKCGILSIIYKINKIISFWNSSRKWVNSFH